MLVIFLIVLCSTAFFWYLQFYWSRRRMYQLASQVPGPKPWPIIGNIAEILSCCPDNAFQYAMKYSDLYPNIGKYWLGHLLNFGIHKPEYFEAVLNSPNALSKAYIYQFTKPLFGWGVLTAPVPLWKRHRRITSHAFNNRIMKEGIDTVNQESIVLVEEMLKKAGQGFFDALPHALNCSLDIICGNSMGFKTHLQTNGLNINMVEIMERINDILALRMFRLRYHFDFTFNLSQLKDEFHALVREFNHVTGRLVEERQKVCRENGRKILLDILLETSNLEGDRLSDVEIRNQVNTFIFAGSDTTSQTISFLMVLLGMHPEVQEKVYSEVLEVVGSNKDAPILWEHLSRLKYTEKVIKETLRLFPPVSFVFREATGEIPLGDGIILPRGSSIGLNIIHVHRNPKYWPDPFKFDPERFDPEEVSKRHPYSYTPFSGGPRNCIGMKYAMMSMKIMVGSLVRKIKFSTKYQKVEDIHLKLQMIITPVGGHFIAVENRP